MSRERVARKRRSLVICQMRPNFQVLALPLVE
jgi:hypothetical protein